MTPSVKSVIRDVFPSEDYGKVVELLARLKLDSSRASDSILCSNMLKYSSGNIDELQNLIDDGETNPKNLYRRMEFFSRWLFFEGRYSRDGFFSYFDQFIIPLGKLASELGLYISSSHFTLIVSNLEDFTQGFKNTYITPQLDERVNLSHTPIDVSLPLSEQEGEFFSCEDFLGAALTYMKSTLENKQE